MTSACELGIEPACGQCAILPDIGKVVATPSPGAVTDLLRAWGNGDDAALERLTPLVEAELRRLARGYMAASGVDTPYRPRRW